MRFSTSVFFIILLHLSAWLICLSNFNYLLEFIKVFNFKKSSRYQWYRRVSLSGINDTAESDSAVSLSPQSQTLRTQWYRGIWLCSISLIPRSQNFLTRGIIDTTESYFRIKYFREFESIFKNILGCELGDQVGLIDEKIPEVKNLMTLFL